MTGRAPGKGEQTRQAILSHALGLATKVGIEGLTIGRLAQDLGMSKSGLIAHFQSKEALQVQVLETGAHRFVEDVLRPALKAPRGEPRLRALFEGFLAWEASPSLPGGCPLIAASTELDDRPGPARDYLVRTRRDLFDLLATTVRSAVEEGQFRPDVDADQFAYEFWGAMLGYHHASRLMRDVRARERARAAFESLVRAASRESPGPTGQDTLPVPAARAGAGPIRASGSLRAGAPDTSQGARRGPSTAVRARAARATRAVTTTARASRAR